MTVNLQRLSFYTLVRWVYSNLPLVQEKILFYPEEKPTERCLPNHRKSEHCTNKIERKSEECGLNVWIPEKKETCPHSTWAMVLTRPSHLQGNHGMHMQHEWGKENTWSLHAAHVPTKRTGKDMMIQFLPPDSPTG